MAKIEKIVNGNFDSIVSKLHEGIIKGSISATYEGGSEYLQD